MDKRDNPCERWEPIDTDGVRKLNRPCRGCGHGGSSHMPAAFFQGLGLSGAGAERVCDAIAATLDD